MADAATGDAAGSAAPTLAAHYFDGRSPRAWPVRVGLTADGLHITAEVRREGEGEGLDLQVPLAGLAWPERQRHGPRVLRLPGGASLSCSDGPAWDALAAAAGRREPAVVRWQQSWRAVAAALVAVMALSGAAWVWGIPLAGEAVTALLPVEVDQGLGRRTLALLDERGLKPSRVPAARQAAWREQVQAAVEGVQRRRQADPELADGLARWPLRLEFRRADDLVNAFALADGTLVITDGMVELVGERHDMLLGVLGHEAGHVLHRHGLRTVVQAGLASALGALVLGDMGSWLAAAPVMLSQLSYSRELERQADATSLALLRANGYDGRPMVDFFERMERRRTAVGQRDGRAGEGPQAEGTRRAGDEDATAGPGPAAPPAPAGGDAVGTAAGASAPAPAASAPPVPSGPSRRVATLAELWSTHPVDDERIAFFHEGR